MRNYELLTVFPGTLTETELEPELKKVKKTLKDSGAEELEVKSLGKTKMAYPMDGVEYGYYHLHQYQLDPDEAQDLRSELDKINSLLRSIIDKYSPEKREKSVDEVKSLQGRDEILKMIKKKHSSDEEEEEDTKDRKSKDKQKEADKKTEQEEESSEDSEKKEEKKEEDEESDVSLDEIDEKLDEILDDEDLTDV